MGQCRMARKTRRCMNDKDLARIKYLVEQRGWTHVMLAQELSYARTTILEHCQRHGIVRPISINKGNKVPIKRIWMMHRQGTNPSLIAKRQGVDYHRTFYIVKQLRAMTAEQRRICFRFEQDVKTLEEKGTHQ